MAVFRCNMCGGTLEINEEEGIATCEYCGTKQSLPGKSVQKRPNTIKKLKTFRDKLKRTLKSNRCLSFVMPKTTYGYLIFTIAFYIYTLIKVGIGVACGHDLFMFSLMCLIFITPLLIFVNVIKNKTVAIVLESISLLWSIVYFSDISYAINNGFFAAIVAMSLLGVVWMVLVCLTRRVEGSPKEKRKLYTSVIPLIFSIILIVLFDMFAFSYVDYQYTKYIGKKLETIEVGDHVWFGEYEQDNDFTNGKEAIGWLVLDKQEDKVLVISHYALDWKMFNDNGGSSSWKHSSIRKWLNSEFLNSAFTSNMHTLISTTNVTPGRNYEKIAFPVEPTQDKVFLLSYEEANNYFKSYEARQCAPTKYAKAQGIGITDGGVNWWLRSPRAYYYTVPTGNSKAASFFRSYMPHDISIDYDYSLAAYVNYAGGINTSGEDLDHKGVGIRPAMWIDMSKVK